MFSPSRLIRTGKNIKIVEVISVKQWLAPHDIRAKRWMLRHPQPHLHYFSSSTLLPRHLLLPLFVLFRVVWKIKKKRSEVWLTDWHDCYRMLILFISLMNCCLTCRRGEREWERLKGPWHLMTWWFSPLRCEPPQPTRHSQCACNLNVEMMSAFNGIDYIGDRFAKKDDREKKRNIDFNAPRAYQTAHKKL